MVVRTDWTMGELKALYAMPLMELITKASTVHAQFHTVGEVQVCYLISIKTGGCSED